MIKTDNTKVNLNLLKEVEELKKECKIWSDELDLQIRFLNIARKENTKLKAQLKECEKNLIDAVGH